MSQHQEVKYFMDEANIDSVKQGQSAKFWIDKATCESESGGVCFDITGKDLRRFKVKNGDLVRDPSGEAQADVEDQARRNEKSLRNQKASDRLQTALDCVAALNSPQALTPQEIKECLAVVIKEVFKDQIPTNDL